MSRDTEEALQKARLHLRRAGLEGLEAASALLQAAMQTGDPADTPGDSWTGNLLRNLEDLIVALRENTSFILPAAVAKPLAEALEAEIRRWEQRSQTDPDARLVLRAFIGLRELLWEFGMRHEAQPTSEKTSPFSRSPRPARPRRDRVQRFDIED